MLIPHTNRAMPTPTIQLINPANLLTPPGDSHCKFATGSSTFRSDRSRLRPLGLRTRESAASYVRLLMGGPASCGNGEGTEGRP
jgi:hypothetical protein